MAALMADRVLSRALCPPPRLESIPNAAVEVSFLLESPVLFSKNFIFPEMSDSKFSCAISQGCGASGGSTKGDSERKEHQVWRRMCAEGLEQVPASRFTAQNLIEHGKLCPTSETDTLRPC